MHNHMRGVASDASKKITDAVISMLYFGEGGAKVANVLENLSIADIEKIKKSVLAHIIKNPKELLFSHLHVEYQNRDDPPFFYTYVAKMIEDVLEEEGIASQLKDVLRPLVMRTARERLVGL